MEIILADVDKDDEDEKELNDNGKEDDDDDERRVSMDDKKEKEDDDERKVNEVVDLAAVAPRVSQGAPPHEPIGAAQVPPLAVNQRNIEQARVRQQNQLQAGRFAPQRIQQSNTCQLDDDTIETAILSAAMSYPPNRILYPSISKFTPNAASIMYYLHLMDSTMVSTSRWTDNCVGWVLPISQIYISVLFYIQVIWAMDAAGTLSPGSPLSSLLNGFTVMFPLDSLWIPGPLIVAFKSIAAFYPSTSGQFGNVTPFFPRVPGRTRARLYSPVAAAVAHLPNISIFISRLQSAINAATTENVTESSFANDVRSPRHIGQIFSQNCTHAEAEVNILSSPGAKFNYGGNLCLWENAAQFTPHLDLPDVLDSAEDEVEDTWADFLFLEEDSSWFGCVSAIMARYCQFFRGSAPLGDCSPAGSAAGGAVCTQVQGNIYNAPTWNDRRGTPHFFKLQRC